MSNYNLCMVYYIEFVVCNLIFDFSASVIYKKVFNLKCKNIYLLLLQTISVVVSVIYLFCINNIVILILLKLLFALLIVLLSAESYKAKNIFAGWLIFEIILFVTIGLYVFLSLFYYEVTRSVFKEKTAKIFKYFAIIVIFLQYLTILCVIHLFKEKKKLKQFLARVEFDLLSEHIKVIGLIDSGNMLYDEKTKLPVVIVGLDTLKKYTTKNNYELITILINHTRKIDCLSASGERFKIPVFDISRGSVERGSEKQEMKFVVGVLEKNICNSSKYECLLHRDFV